MNRTIAAALTSLAFLAFAWPVAAEDIASPVVGLWKLTSNTTKIPATGAMEHQAGEHPSGYQLFTKGGRMMFFQVAENRKAPAQPAPTVAEKAALFDALIAYSGTYRVEGSKVLIHIDVNEYPQTAERTYTMEISGNKLMLTSDPFVTGSGQHIVSIRTFDRAE
jgi:hypothetical protein